MIIHQTTATSTLLTLLLTITITTTTTSSRYLRPSEHGLTFQSLPTHTPDMFHFFGNSITSPPYKPPMTNDISGVGGSSDDGWVEGRRVKWSGLVVATVVSGGTGVVLLLVAGVLFGFRFYRPGRE